MRDLVTETDGLINEYEEYQIAITDRFEGAGTGLART